VWTQQQITDLGPFRAARADVLGALALEETRTDERSRQF